MPERLKNPRHQIAAVAVAAAVIGTVGATTIRTSTPPVAPPQPDTTTDLTDGPISVAALRGDSCAVYRIVDPGEYYIDADLTGEPRKHGIYIAADDVVLDLRGYSLTGVSNSLSGIHVQYGAERVSVRNGSIIGWLEHGVSAGGASEVELRNVHSIYNAADGVVLGDRATVVSCFSLSNGGTGIRAGRGTTIHETESSHNSVDGIAADFGVEITSSTADYNTGVGIRVGHRARCADVTTQANEAGGIVAAKGSVFTNSYATGNKGTGFRLNGDGLLNNCHAEGNEGHGFSLGSDSTGTILTSRHNGAAALRGSSGNHISEISITIGVDSTSRGIEFSGVRNQVSEQ